MARLWYGSWIVASAMLLAGCGSDTSIIDTPALAMAVAAEQCGNEFHLGQPAQAESAGDDWVVSWPSSAGHATYTTRIDGELGVPLGCAAANS